VHGLNQVVHVDAPVEREPFSWVRGTNRYLPADIAVQWCRAGGADFHARNSARGRRYRFVVLESPVRPALEQGCAAGCSARWTRRHAAAAAHLIGEHDFTSFRAAGCQARSPVKTCAASTSTAAWRLLALRFDASAFLHHMVRNILGCLVAVGSGRQPPDWMAEVLAARDRDAARPPFRPTACTSWGRTTMPAMRLPEHGRRWTGCPE
jgi:tRNA pseudouridine38-40 synthase